MSKIIIVSNRLPIELSKKENSLEVGSGERLSQYGNQILQDMLLKT